MFKIGKTIAIAAVYGPRELYPSFLQNPHRAVLRCNYNMMAFSGSGDRVRPGPSRRSKEISMVMSKSLMPMIDLSIAPLGVIDVYVELVQTDAGTRCAALTAASMALADAGIPMKDLISSVAVGRIGDKVVLDVDKLEEDYPEGMADIPIAMSTRTGEITLLQADGEFSKEQLREGMELAKKGCEQIKQVQIKALKEKYMGGDEK
jgi:exosome complex component RRP41